MTAADAGTAAPSHRWAMLAGVWLVYACFGATAAAIAPLVSHITEELALSHTQMGSILGAWQFVYIGAAIPCGALLDRLGARRGLTLGALVVAASGIMRGLATDYPTMLLAVAAFGIGGPLVSVGAPKVISQWFVGRERGLAMGVYNVGQAVGTIFALLLTSSVGLALAGGNWRLVLIVYGIVALAAALVWYAIGSHGASRAMEQRSAAEPRQNQAEIFVELLRVPALRTILVLAFGTFFFGHALTNWLPEILRAGGMDLASAGLWASVPVFVGIAGALIFPRLAVPRRRMAILSGLFAAQMLAPLLIEWNAGMPLALGLVLQGLARGSLSIVVVLVLMELPEVDSRRMGAAAGLYFTAGEIGGVLGPLTIGTLYDLTGGFAAGLTCLAALCLWQLLLLTRLRAVLR
ncbi:MAG: major facilitator superfamily 1 [Rhodospirillales bacterium]|nr:major facilitator superfamily 1 [Rhodospirillales bacterium]